MAKVKIRETVERETDIDLPIYLHFRGEMLDEEYVKWDGEVCTKVVFCFNDVIVESSDSFCLREHDLTKLVQAVVFEENLDIALNTIRERL